MSVRKWSVEEVDLADEGLDGAYNDPDLRRFPHRTFAFECPGERARRVFAMLEEDDDPSSVVGRCLKCTRSYRFTQGAGDDDGE